MTDIFLSYARADQPRVAKLATALEQSGYSLWWDQHIKGGHKFAKDIEAAMSVAKVVIVAWSKTAIESEWVLDEAAYARDADKLVPITLDDSLPPLGFRQRQAIDFSVSTNDRDALDRLFAVIDDKLSRATRTRAAQPSKASRWARGALIALPLLALAGGAAWWAKGEGYFPGDGQYTEAGKTNQSIAILPFRDLSPEKESWFSDGLAQEISAALARTPDLKVAPTSESFRFRERAQSMVEIGKALGVARILDGSVRRTADRIVVDIELIDTATGERVFTQSYDRPISDTITVQEEIATQIARTLNTALDPKALAGLVDSGTNSVEAYETYLKAVQQSGTFTADVTADDTIAALRRAVELDPQYSQAYIAIANIIGGKLSPGSALSDETADRDLLRRDYLDAIAHAEATAKNELERLWVRIQRQQFNGDFRGAAETSRQIIRLSPTRVDGLRNLYVSQIILQDRAGAARTTDRMAELEDSGTEGFNYIINRYYDAMAPEKALAFAAKAGPEEQLSADFLYQVHRASLAAGKIDQAKDYLRRLDAMPDIVGQLKLLAHVRQACADGDRASAEALLPKLKGRQNSYWQALMLLGRRAEATELQRHLDTPDAPYGLPDLLYYPFFDPRPYPNLMQMMKRNRIPVPQRIYFNIPACPPAGKA